MNRRTKTAIGIVTGVVLIVLCVAVVAGYRFLKERDKLLVQRATFDSVELGQREDDIAHTLPHGQLRLMAKFRKQCPPRPGGAGCRYYLSKDEKPAVKGRLVIYRFCFANGSLVEKLRFEAGSDSVKA